MNSRLLKPTRMLALRSGLLLLVGTAVLFGLSGCGTIQQDITLSDGEKWEAEMRLGLTPEELGFAGGDVAIQTQLERALQDLDSQGIDHDLDRKSEGDQVVYVITMSGQGYEGLNEAVFDGGAGLEPIVYEGKSAYEFRLYQFTDAREYQLTLRAGEILATNGEKLDARTVQWTGMNPNMTAVFVPRGGLTLLPVAMLVLLALLAGVAAILYQSWQRRQRGQAVAALPAAYCHQCGAKLEPQSKYCLNCGAARL